MASVVTGPGLHELARGVYAWIGPEGRTNAGFVVWDDGVLVIDSLYGPDLVKEWLQKIRSVTDRPIQYVIDTHAHWDHAFGNQYFEPAVFVSHENCRLALAERSEFQRQFGLARRPELADEFNSVRMVPPVVTYRDSMALYPGGRAIELYFLGPAHTAGDTIVWLPEERIAFAGDVFVNGRSGFAGDGYPRSWVQALRRLEGFAAEVFVPGHGDLGALPSVTAMRTWMDHCVLTIGAARARGMTVEQAQQQLKLTVPEGWPDPQGGTNLIAPYYRETATSGA
jgi:glyoxylase-like metal-dependent hydrolase (beta-lactamase superfamily II)